MQEILFQVAGRLDDHRCELCGTLTDAQTRAAANDAASLSGDPLGSPTRLASLKGSPSIGHRPFAITPFLC
jgi:hypothetical protein